MRPERHEIVEVQTSRGVLPVMLIAKIILQAEWAAYAPFREAMAIKRKSWAQGNNSQHIWQIAADQIRSQR